MDNFSQAIIRKHQIGEIHLLDIDGRRIVFGQLSLKLQVCKYFLSSEIIISS